MNKPGILRFFLPVVNIFLLYASAGAQGNSNLKYTDIHYVGLARGIDTVVSSTYIGKRENPESVFSTLHFTPGLEHRRMVPDRFVSKKILLQFNICNSADTAMSVYFFPGFYYENIRLYRSRATGLEKIASVLPDVPDRSSFRLISLEPHDSATIVAELSFLKTYTNTIRPRLLNRKYISFFLAELRISRDHNNLFTYFFCGLLMTIILFSITSYFQGAGREYLFYCGYAFFLGMMLFTKARFNLQSNAISFFLESYLDFILQGLGIILYMLFMQRFLNTKSKHRFLYHLYNTGIVLMLLSLAGFSYFNYFSDNFVLQNGIESGTKVLLLGLILVFLIYSLRHTGDKLLRYIFIGNLFLFLFSLVSQFIVMLNIRVGQVPEIFSSSLFYYEFGLLLELVFFLAGLNYKSRSLIIEQTKEREQLKAENQLKEYEKELAVYKAQQQERERISADMHDELGSGMTAIRLLSEIARNKMKENTPVEIDKISSSANDVLNKMNAIIWSMNSGNDSLDNLISYIRSYALEYFENTPIQCKVITPQQIPDIEISGDKRRNVFLCVKETLNNAFKHSGASMITIEINAGANLVISIADNGRGIDLENIRQFGNGLKNMSQRMKNIGGSFQIEKNNGTITTLSLPF